MTKLEICAIEDANPGRVYLYPEGAFYKAYQKSAWLLCTRVHPFKVSVRPLKGLDGYAEWVSGLAKSLAEGVSRKADAPFNSLPVYGAAYRLAVEATRMASRLERNYRYSLGEDIRRGVGHTLVCIMLAGKGEEREANVHAARVSMLEVQLANWERSGRQRGNAAGMPSPP